MELETNPQLELAKKYIEETSTNVFLTGKAGTGKTTFLNNLRKTIFKRNIVVAPTGVAAINANGVTIHSFFQVSFGPYIPNHSEYNSPIKRFSKQKINIIRGLDLLIIDEISMVRADLLDAIDNVLRRYRVGGRNIPFGGVQLLLIGDLQQLIPVCKDDEWDILSKYYSSPFFFSSKALESSSFRTINLEKVFRQKDEDFIKILNNIRNNTIDNKTYEALNKRYIPNFQPKDRDGYISLCTHNYQARDINNKKLNSLENPSFIYKANIEGEFLESAYPNDVELELKLDSQIMFLKNDYSPDSGKIRFYNGKIGKITKIDKDEIIVRCIGEDADIEVSKHIWHNYKYEINKETNQIDEKIIGSFEQYPIKLAWAITIHKSQGLTFDRVIVDSNKSFASGQVYVALSRCRTLEGIVLSSMFNPSSIKLENALINFDIEQEKNYPNQDTFEKDKEIYFENNVFELISFTELKYIIDELSELNNTLIYKLYMDSSKEINNYIIQFNKDIIEVSYKFKGQINLLFQNKNSELIIERLKKSGGYFKDKLSVIGKILSLISKLDFDNKEIEKKKNTIINKLIEENIIKSSLLDLSIKGFNLKEYLNLKNILLSSDEKLLNNERSKNDKKETYSNNKSSDTPQKIENNKLFETLKAWRYAKSKELDIPAYRIITQKSLIDIINKMPMNSKELLNTHGIGEKKLEEFGREILEIVSEFKLLEN